MAVHPTKYKCKLCEQIFETSIALECHLKDHDAEEMFKCDLFAKTTYMKWRLGKHQSQHGSTKNKVCHYFNNALLKSMAVRLSMNILLLVQRKVCVDQNYVSSSTKIISK